MMPIDMGEPFGLVELDILFRKSPTIKYVL